MTDTIVAVVLAGGTGTRLYPASRSDRPKQFLSFGGDRSLLAETVDRAGGPALTYAAHRVREQVGDCTLVCLPSDHHVEREGATERSDRRTSDRALPASSDFAETMTDAAGVAAETDSLVAVGVEPTRPETGYGYVKPGDEATTDGGRTYYPVETFTEKPDQGAAMRYRHHGYYWNAGMFAWTPDAFLREAADTELAPLVDALDDGDPERGFAAVDPVSVDYAVLESTESAAVVAADFEWDDLGAWDAVERVRESDEDGNVVLGDGLTVDTENTVIATDGHVSVVGVDDLVVASYGDRTL
ncbi:mannose-1-phosphate guanyltransferase, partial [Halobacteriales archaeon QH_8_67_27]